MMSLGGPRPVSPFASRHPPLSSRRHRRPAISFCVRLPSASSLQPPAPAATPYQPFRPPPSWTPDLSLDEVLNTLRNRLGLWYDYAPLISLLSQNYGFSPPSIEESTGISGVEQNRLVVAAKVRESLLPNALDTGTLAFFDVGGAEILYELRLLSNSQRAAAARWAVERRLDAKGAQDLARAIKDFPRRKGEPGWEAFSYVSPGDCLAFWNFRQSREHRNSTDVQIWLERAAEEADTDAARKRIAEELNKLLGGRGSQEVGEPAREAAKVPVVRLKMGEVAESSSVAVLPVCEANAGEIADAPECGAQGEFRVVAAEKGWRKWVVLPGWAPVAAAGPSTIAISFVDARILPWKVNEWSIEETILVVADRERKEVEEDAGFYLVSGESGSLMVERGQKLKAKGVKEGLGSVVIVVRPPKDEPDDQLSDEDWE